MGTKIEFEEIYRTIAEIKNDLNQNVKAEILTKYTSASTTVQQSKGDFADRLRDQLNAEKDMVEATTDTLLVLLDFLREATESYETLDEQMGKTFKEGVN